MGLLGCPDSGRANIAIILSLTAECHDFVVGRGGVRWGNAGLSTGRGRGYRGSVDLYREIHRIRLRCMHLILGDISFCLPPSDFRY